MAAPRFPGDSSVLTCSSIQEPAAQGGQGWQERKAWRSKKAGRAGVQQADQSRAWRGQAAEHRAAKLQGHGGLPAESCLACDVHWQHGQLQRPTRCFSAVAPLHARRKHGGRERGGNRPGRSCPLLASAAVQSCARHEHTLGWSELCSLNLPCPPWAPPTFCSTKVSPSGRSAMYVKPDVALATALKSSCSTAKGQRGRERTRVAGKLSGRVQRGCRTDSSTCNTWSLRLHSKLGAGPTAAEGCPLSWPRHGPTTTRLHRADERRRIVVAGNHRRRQVQRLELRWPSPLRHLAIRQHIIHRCLHHRCQQLCQRLVPSVCGQGKGVRGTMHRAGHSWACAGPGGHQGKACAGRAAFRPLRSQQPTCLAATSPEGWMPSWYR